MVLQPDYDEVAEMRRQDPNGLRRNHELEKASRRNVLEAKIASTEMSDDMRDILDTLLALID